MPLLANQSEQSKLLWNLVNIAVWSSVKPSLSFFNANRQEQRCCMKKTCWTDSRTSEKCSPSIIRTGGRLCAKPVSEPKPTSWPADNVSSNESPSRALSHTEATRLSRQIQLARD